jgi:hypothetical protein
MMFLEQIIINEDVHSTGPKNPKNSKIISQNLKNTDFLRMIHKYASYEVSIKILLFLV